MKEITMCGSLRLNTPDLVGKDPQPASWVRPGGNVEVTTKDGKTHKARWNGWARKETLKEVFLDKGWKSCDVLASGYTEKGREYDLGKNYTISGICLDIPGRGRMVNVTTRKSRGKECEVHDRWPIITKRRF